MPVYKLSFGLITIFLFSCQQNNTEEYEVNGTIKNAPVKTIYLEEVSTQTMQPLILDSALLEKDGSFNLSTISKEVTLYNLRLGGSRFPFISFINDSRSITINADLQNFEDPYTINGSAASQSLKEYLFTLGKKINDLKNIQAPKDSLNYKKEARDSMRLAIVGQRDPLIAEIKNYAARYITNSQHAPLTLYALSTYQSLSANPNFGLQPFSETELRTLASNGLKKFPKNNTLIALNKSLLPPATNSSVMMAPDFTLPDVNGQPVALSSFKGKYVLVDFWASWCPPCRAENPNVLAAYRTFKNKNFTVLGVSLDKEKSAWQQAIAQDSLTWSHVSDLKFWDSMVVPLYGFNSIPYNVLLDPTGTIIAQNLFADTLQRKLHEVLK